MTETHPAALPSDHVGLIERLTEIANHDWRFSFLAHTSDTAREALAALGRVQPVAVNTKALDAAKAAVRQREISTLDYALEVGIKAYLESSAQ